MGFPGPPTDNQALRSIDEAMQERRRSERRWRIATLVVALLAVCISAGSLIVALVK